MTAGKHARFADKPTRKEVKVLMCSEVSLDTVDVRSHRKSKTSPNEDAQDANSGH